MFRTLVYTCNVVILVIYFDRFWAIDYIFKLTWQNVVLFPFQNNLLIGLTSSTLQQQYIWRSNIMCELIWDIYCIDI